MVPSQRGGSSTGARRYGLVGVVVGGCAEPPPAEPPDGFVPAVVYVAGAFGYDPATNDAVPYRIDGEEAPIRIDVTVVDDRYFDAGDAAWRCTRTAEVRAPLGHARWTAGTGLAFGFSLPDDVVWQGECPEPPEGVRSAADLVAAGSWGLGIGPLAPGVESWLRRTVDREGGDGTFAASWAPWVVGAGFRWSALEDVAPSGFVANDYATAAAAPGGDVTLDDDGDPALLPAEEAVANPLPAAVFSVGLVYGVDVATLDATGD